MSPVPSREQLPPAVSHTCRRTPQVQGARSAAHSLARHRAAASPAVAEGGLERATRRAAAARCVGACASLLPVSALYTIHFFLQTSLTPLCPRCCLLRP